MLSAGSSQRSPPMWQISNHYNFQGPVCADWIMADRGDIYMWGSEPNMEQGNATETQPPPSNMTGHAGIQSTHPPIVNGSPKDMKEGLGNGDHMHMYGDYSKWAHWLKEAHMNPQPQSPATLHPPHHPSSMFTSMPGPSTPLPGPQMTVHHTPKVPTINSVTSSSGDIPSTNTPLVIPQPVRNPKPATKTYHCRMCNQELPNKSAMQKHAKEVHMLDQKAHKCEKCFKSFPTSQQLQQHMLVHSNLRRYKCGHCDKAFKQLSHVQQHQRIHTGEKPYRCTVEGCERAFAQLSNLQHHMRHHEGHHPRICMDRKPWQCNICDRRFATDASLNNHITKFHCDPEKASQYHPCPRCDKEFRTKLDLQNHLKDAHLSQSPDTEIDDLHRHSRIFGGQFMPRLPPSTGTHPAFVQPSMVSNGVKREKDQMRDSMHMSMRPMIENLFSTGPLSGQRRYADQSLGIFSRSASLPNINPPPASHTVTRAMHDNGDSPQRCPSVSQSHSPPKSYLDTTNNTVQRSSPTSNDYMDTTPQSPPLPTRSYIDTTRSTLHSSPPSSRGYIEDNHTPLHSPNHTGRMYSRHESITESYIDTTQTRLHMQSPPPSTLHSARYMPGHLSGIHSRPDDHRDSNFAMHYVDPMRESMHSPPPDRRPSSRSTVPSSSYVDTTQTRLHSASMGDENDMHTANHSGSLPSSSYSNNMPTSSLNRASQAPNLNVRDYMSPPPSQLSHSHPIFPTLFPHRQ